MQQCAHLFLFLLIIIFWVDLPLAHWLVWLARWQWAQAGLNAVIQPAAESRMTGPILATCCPCPLPPFRLLRVPKGAVLSKQDEVIGKRPVVNLWVNFSFAMKLQKWPLGKETVLNTVPRSVVGSEGSQYSTVEICSWQDLPLESFCFFLCDPDLVDFIQPQYSHVQDGPINSPVSHSC